jgi:hypothetical protein
MFVSDKEYYLQSDKYKEVQFSLIDGRKANYADEGLDTIDSYGAGMKIDLKNGLINSYNFKLESKNVYINSANGADAFFVVKNDEGKNLLFAGNS